MLYLLMFLQIGAMFYALRLHRRRQLFANMIPASIAVQIFGVGAAFVAILKVVLLISFTGVDKEKVVQQAHSEYIALWHVGNLLADKYSGKKLLVVIAPENEADSNQKNRIDGLKEAIGDKLDISFVSVDYVKTKKRKRRVAAYSFENLNKIIKANDENEVIITLIGLPVNYYNMDCWNKELPDLYVYRGYSWELDQDIKNGEITAFITINPDNKFKASKGKKAEKSTSFFEKHFLFIDKRNVAKMRKEYPRLFVLPAGKK
jgi:hypothetical protein